MATPYMNLGLPTVSSTPGPTYAVNINAALSSIDSHNHTSGRGVQIPTAALNINADLTLNTKSLNSVGSVRLVDQSSPLAAGLDNDSLYAANGNLYFNNFSGTPVQITSGTAVNAAAFGGWTGDYVAAGAQGKYTTATQSFSLINGNASLSTLYLNKVSVGQADGTSLGTQQVTIVGPTTVNGTSTLTAVNASGNVSVAGTLGVTGASTLGTTGCGALTATTATVTGTSTLTGAVSCGAITSTGSISTGTGNISSALGSLTLGSGNITAANAAVTCTSLAASSGITAGSAIVASGTIGAASFTSNTGTAVALPSTSYTLPVNIMDGIGGAGLDATNFYPTVTFTGSTSPYFIALRLPTTCTITQVGITSYATAINGTNNIIVSLAVFPISTAGTTLLSSSSGANQTVTGFANRTTTTTTPNTAITSATTGIYVIRVIQNAVSATNTSAICAATVTYTCSALEVGQR